MTLYGWNGGMMGGWGFGLGWLLQLLVFVVVIYLAFILIKRLNVPSNADRRENRSEDILKERFAKGEITEEEYKKMKEVLKD
ncbi:MULTISPECIES: SHOCT domain-containing protein [unclassified Sporolactobacillus]|uniref:SHOCT domain-containing protein n=1 Tax=unclassified Sporolactobacillus TaxID=2628533 RepID=UPI002368A7DA|nr:SHOCT domain-containing protein [Sporolactobacillus sp. CQH2019]MDD9149177.1 SHOCT domain-containing protein [Sporolactobacillus sp. CQH2019]